MLKQAGEDLLAFDPESLEVHELNSLAASVARLCDGAHSCEQIVASIGAQFDLVAEDAARETYRALVMLREERLIDAA